MSVYIYTYIYIFICKNEYNFYSIFIYFKKCPADRHEFMLRKFTDFFWQNFVTGN